MSKEFTLFVLKLSVFVGIVVALIAAPEAVLRARPEPSAAHRPAVTVSALEARHLRGEQLTPTEKAQYLAQQASPGASHGGGHSLDTQSGADAYGYYFLDNLAPDTASFAWIELCGDPLVTNGPSGDDGAALATWGWDFPFYEGTYSSVYISTNGLLQFDATIPASSWTNVCPFAATNPTSPRIAVYWDDLYAAVSGGCTDNGVGPWVRWRDFGSYWVVEWSHVPHFNTADRLTFEAILYPDGAIKFQYQSISAPVHPNGASIGIDAPGDGYGVEYLTCNASTLPNGTTNRAVWITRQRGIPHSVTNLAGTAVGENVTLTWTDPTQDTYGMPLTVDSVEVWYRAPGTGTRLAVVAAGVQTYTITGAPQGHPTYFVRPVHGGLFDVRPSASVTVTVGNPTYSENFEFADGMWAGIPVVGGFEWGHPTYFRGPEAHSGSHLWGTVLDGPYPGGGPHGDGACLKLDLELRVTVFSPEATVEFWMWYHAENGYDGCNFQVSADSGMNWEVVTPLEGYTRPFLWENPCIGAETPCWEGGSDGWRYTVLPIGAYLGDVLRFRLTFGSDWFQDTPQAGFYFDDMVMWGVAAPPQAAVSGSVTLDGGSGAVTQALVVVGGHGLGGANTHPAANGSYVLSDALPGERSLLGVLAGYRSDTVAVTVPEDGLPNVNFTLRRLDPPPPATLTAAIGNGMEPVALDWEASPDPLVDGYRIYRKPSTSLVWTLAGEVTTTAGSDLPPASGTYDYKVTAVDTNVAPPSIESAGSNIVTVLWGSPGSLSANSNFDDRVRLNWVAPGTLPAMQLGYDDGTAELFMVLDWPNRSQNYFAVRFTPPSADTMTYPLAIQACNIYLERSDPVLPSVVVCPDSGGMPDMLNPYVSWQDIGTETPLGEFSPGWLTADAGGQVWLTDDDDFWLVWQLPAHLEGPGVGYDSHSADGRSYYTEQSPFLGDWELMASGDWMARVWLSVEPGNSVVASVGEPSGYCVDRVASGVGPVRRSATTIRDAFPVTTARGFDQPYSQAPELVSRARKHGHGLDEIVQYNIYRNGTLLTSTTAPWYLDPVTENVPFSYYVTAVYANATESGPSRTIQARANMAPGAPGNVSATPIGGTQIRITWTDPTVNMDGSPCVDLASLVIYRDSTQVGIVNPGVQEFTATPPQANRYYMWTVRARDEIPNEGPGSSAAGVVADGWRLADYSWLDLTENGIDAGLGEEFDMTGPFPLGFDFPFYGTAHPSVMICKYGYLRFAGTGAMETNQSLPSAAQPNNAIYPFWDHLTCPAADARILYRAYTNPRRFVVSYLNVAHADNPDARYSFQVVLDPNGGVTFNYQSISAGEPGNTSCTVGVENGAGTSALRLCSNGSGDYYPTDSTAVDFWGGTSRRLEGVVRAQVGNARLSGVLVQPQGTPEYAYTDAAGFYSLPLEPGTYTVCYTLPGYCDGCLENIVVVENSVTTRNTTLSAPGIQLGASSITLDTWPTHDVTTSFVIENTGLCPLEFTLSDTSAWLSATASTDSVLPHQTTQVVVTASASGLTPGNDYQSLLTITSNASGSPHSIPVFLAVALGTAPAPQSVPTEYALYDNYPNPFNATTRLRFDLPEPAFVALTLYNVMGQATATIVDGWRPAGRHQLQYDAGGLPSGMYLLTLRAGDYTAMKKVLLLK